MTHGQKNIKLKKGHFSSLVTLSPY